MAVQTAFEAPLAAHRQCSALLNRLADSRSGPGALKPEPPAGQASSRRRAGQAPLLGRLGKRHRPAQDRSDRVIEHGERDVEPIVHRGKAAR